MRKITQEISFGKNRFNIVSIATNRTANERSYV